GNPHDEPDHLVQREVEREGTAPALQHECRRPPAYPGPVPDVEAGEQDDDEADREPRDHVLTVGDHIADHALDAARLGAGFVDATPARLGIEDTEDAVVLPQVHVAAVHPPGEAGFLVAHRIDASAPGIDVRDLVAVRLLPEWDLGADLVDAASVAGHRGAVHR